MTDMKLNIVRDSIESMNQQNHIDVLKILIKHKDICLNSNKSGIRVNLTELKPEVIHELIDYINYICKNEINYQIKKKSPKFYWQFVRVRKLHFKK